MRVTGPSSRLSLIAVLWTAQVAGQEFTISTVAGGAPPLTPAVATTAAIGRPLGVAADSAGNVYFASSNYFVFKRDTAGVLTIIAGNARRGFSGDGGPATSAQLNFGGNEKGIFERTAVGLAVDNAGSVYIADTKNQRIRRVSPSGIITTVAGTGDQGDSGDGGPATSARLNNPTGVAVDGAGNLYIGDAGNRQVRRVSSSGIITAVPGTQSASGGSNILCVAVDVDGNLYISDNDTVRRVTPSGDATTIGDDLSNPGGIAVDGAGSLYIADTNHNRVRRHPTTAVIGGIYTVTGTGVAGFSGDGGPATSAQLDAPVDLAVDGTGNLYIADRNNLRIRRVSQPTQISSSSITTVAGNGTASYSGDGGLATNAQINATGIAVGSTGGLYLAEPDNHRIRYVSPSGFINTVVGTGQAGYSGDGGPASSAQIFWPAGVALEAAGNLYVADFGNYRVRRVSPVGIIGTVAGNGTAGFSGDGGPATSAQLSPSDVVIDAAGNLYVTDMQRIRRVSPSGAITTVAGNGSQGYSGDGGPATSAQISSRPGVVVDQIGNIYIADTWNYRVRRVSPSGVISTVAGNGSQGYSGDGGPATSARLNLPTGVAVDQVGNLYIADSMNYRIRRVSPSGIITTVAGTGDLGYSGDGGPATSAQLEPPFRIAVDGEGRIYFTQYSYSSAVRVLTPTSCAISASPTTLTAAEIGGALSFSIQATPGCAWTVTGLPAWITASTVSGSGPATVTLTVTANTGIPRSVTITAAGTAITITQGASAGALGMSCTSTEGPSTVGFEYNVACTATNGIPPYHWSIGAGELPAGLGFAAGTSAQLYFTGAPTIAGSYSFRLVVTDAVGASASQDFAGKIAASLSVICFPADMLPTVGFPHSQSCRAYGGVQPYVWSISEGSLPPGLALNATTGEYITIGGTASAAGAYPYSLTVVDAGKPAQSATWHFSGTVSSALRTFNAASYEEGTLAPDSIASVFGSGLANFTESYDGSVMNVLGGSSLYVDDSAGESRVAQLFYASDGQINFLVPADTAKGTVHIRVTNNAVPPSIQDGSAVVADVAPGIFVVSGGSTVPAAFYLRVTPAEARIQDYTFNPQTLEAVAIPRNSGDDIYLLLFGTGFRHRKGNVTATVNGQEVPVLGAVAQGQFAGLDQVNIGPLPANLAAGIVMVHLEFDGIPANDITVLLQ